MSKIEKRDKKIRKKSSCWLFYTKHDRGGICRLCQKRIISNGNTTNLLNHLKRKHRIQWEAATEENEEDSIDTHMEFEEDEDQEGESIELHRSTKEAHEQGLAYQSSDGRTVIWLHPDVQLDQLSALQPQITVVEHASSNNAKEATAEVSETKDSTGILGIGELVQKEEDTMNSDEVVQKADTTDQSHSLVLNDGEVIQHDDINSDNVAQIVTVSSSEDPSTEDNPVQSSPSNIVLANLVTSDASNIMHDSIHTSPSKKRISNIKTNPSNIMLGNLTKTTSMPQRTVVVTRCSPSFKTRPIQPKPQWVPIQMVGQTPVNDVVQNKSSVKSSVSILKNNSGYGGQNSAGSYGGQNSTGSCGGQNSTGSCGEQKNTESTNKQNKQSGKQKKSKKSRNREKPRAEDAFDHFGKYIAALLRNLPSKRSAYKLQKEMLNCVLKEQIMYDF